MRSKKKDQKDLEFELYSDSRYRSKSVKSKKLKGLDKKKYKDLRVLDEEEGT